MLPGSANMAGVTIRVSRVAKDRPKTMACDNGAQNMAISPSAVMVLDVRSTE